MPIPDIYSILFDQLDGDQFSKPQFEQAAVSSFSLDTAIESALKNPLHFPAFTNFVFPGDHVAIVLQAGIPHPRQILFSLLKQFQQASIDFKDIVIAVSRRTANHLDILSADFMGDANSDPSDEPTDFWFEIGEQKVRLQIHDPEQSSSIAYIVANEAGDPVYLNRLLVDADVVFPVAYPSAGSASQQIDCIYPEFSSTAVQDRFSSAPPMSAQQIAEIELANSTLGSFSTMQVVSGTGEQIQNILFGVRADTNEAARCEANNLWEFEWDGKADVTVATIESSPAEQNWDDFARALLTASHVTAAGAPLIIWSNISDQPHRRIRKACVSQFEETISSKLSQEMQQLAVIISEHPVYLKSLLPSGDVESLGLGHLDSAEEINRIASDCSSGLLLRDAHKCQVRTPSPQE